MALDDYLERIVSKFARDGGEPVAVEREEPATSEALLASAEYELQEVYRDIAIVRKMAASRS